jgi:tRNA 2-selenouridine synthase
MIRNVNIEEIIDNKNVVFIDVRSEKEFNEDTIPGALNIPILNNEERENVGYLYKQVDKEKAKEVGIEYASKKLPSIYIKAKEISRENKDIALFCYRGGMRSKSVANVLDLMGLDVYLINGGYKEYRKYVIKKLIEEINKHKYIVLHGYTGVGKTKILKLLKEKGEPILDIESLAKNKGSVFGNIGYDDSNITQKNFESKLLKVLSNVNEEYIFVESESKRIGKVILPEPLYKNMENGYHLLINTSIENRVKNILDDYIKENNSVYIDESIINAINKLRKRISNSIAYELIEKVKHKEYSYVAKKLMLHYYDPLYKYSIDKIKVYDKIIEYKDINNAVEELLSFKNSLLK